MKKRYKIAAICCFCGSAASLVVGASFHGLRMQPENPELFNLGVTMVISMLGLSTLCIVAGIVLVVKGKKRR
ncbi:MAG: hypothetical protein J6A19_16015 [Oscillospiraceae bacterium]|nr:hypothetical protein [Oscillospiraceae bacterium]